MVKQRASESDGETGITVAAATAADDDRDRFHLEITDPAERRRLLLQQLCFDDECNEDEKRRIAELCCKYTYTFAVTELELGRCNFMEAAIETGDAPPFVEPARRTPFRKQAMIEEELDRMEKLGIIRESTSPWSS
ncbi:MAG: hypothetical protein GY738_22105, partial [Pseudoalteromonas sp.]|nr:hypothetical protein [Pseudoalteromonas sp.]